MDLFVFSYSLIHFSLAVLCVPLLLLLPYLEIIGIENPRKTCVVQEPLVVLLVIISR